MTKLEQAKDWLRKLMVYSLDDEKREYCKLILEKLADKGEVE